MRITPLEQRVTRYFEPGAESDCWPWTGCLNRGGYGLINGGPARKGRSLGAHRVVYELSVGPIPEGMHLDHTCHTNDPVCRGGPCTHRRCVNPAHLEPVEPPENGRRVPVARRTLCPYGHKATRGPDGSKRCNRCEADRQVVVRAELKAGLRPAPRLITCSDCQKIKPLCARDLCRGCYTNQYRRGRGKVASRPGRYRDR
jgi:hypothetical protein